MNGLAPDSTDALLNELRRHRRRLEACGVEHVAIFGSRARGEASPDSDVDVFVEIGPGRRARGLSYFSQIDRIRSELHDILQTDVDVVASPIQGDRLASQIRNDARRAF